MHIAVDHHGPSDEAVTLHAADGNGHIIEHAKPFPVICEGVVEAASNVDAAVISQRLPGGNNRSPGDVPECLHQFFAVRDFQFQFLARAQRSALQLLDPQFGVDQKNVLILAGRRSEKVVLREGSSLQQALPHSPVLTGVEDAPQSATSLFPNKPAATEAYSWNRVLWARIGKRLFHRRIVMQVDGSHVLRWISGRAHCLSASARNFAPDSFKSIDIISPMLLLSSSDSICYRAMTIAKR